MVSLLFQLVLLELVQLKMTVETTPIAVKSVDVAECLVVSVKSSSLSVPVDFFVDKD